MGRLEQRTLRMLIRHVTLMRNGCWQWVGATTPRGYPIACVNGNTKIVKRLFYEHFKGITLDYTLRLTDLCGNRQCINPDHRMPASYSEINKARAGYKKKTCHRGHPFTPENTYTFPSRKGWRSCKTCYKEKYGVEFGSLIPNADKTHCPNGHEYTPENTYYRYRETLTGRMCKTCNRERARARQVVKHRHTE